MLAAVVSDIGRRAEMEDTHNLDTDFGGQEWIFGGVYDGHGGRYAAEFVADNIPRLFLAAINEGRDPLDAFKTCYEKISSDLRWQKTGTAAVNFFIRNGMIYAANAGDARALVINKQSLAQLTVDHRVDNPEERKRIEEKEGMISGRYVIHYGKGLMPTRTIGDEFFKPVGVIATPSLKEHKIQPDDIVLIAACDGLFDVLLNDEIAEIARKNVDPDRLLETLKKEVLIEHDGSDNLTIIAVDLQRG
jgi:serine/threonine protein phosphatase PrpC